MRVCVTFPLPGRDLRLDLFRGLANWAIFLDHIPHEVMSSITTRNYGFSDAADLFVFISGYTPDRASHGHCRCNHPVPAGGFATTASAFIHAGHQVRSEFA